MFDNSLTSLAKEIVNALDSDVPETAIKLSKSEMPKEAAAASVPEVDIQKKPGRAFLHKLTGKFLAESGKVEFKEHGGLNTESLRKYLTKQYSVNLYCNLFKTSIFIRSYWAGLMPLPYEAERNG